MTISAAASTTKPALRADWMRAVFIHFRAQPRLLQTLVPFQLDTFDGDVYVSLVAFTQEHLRPRIGGRIAAVISAPLASHGFLNLRTYVRHRGHAGIYFLSEWIPNRLAVFVGPRTYGLPYKLGRLHYAFRDDGTLDASVEARNRALRFTGRFDAGAGFHHVREGTLDHFLIERYTAFTSRGNIRRRFDVEHEPWSQQQIRLEAFDTSIIQLAGLPPHALELVGANFSPGVRDVGISFPKRE